MEVCDKPLPHPDMKLGTLIYEFKVKRTYYAPKKDNTEDYLDIESFYLKMSSPED